jgi:hypothetical protein
MRFGNAENQGPIACRFLRKAPLCMQHPADLILWEYCSEPGNSLNISALEDAENCVVGPIGRIEISRIDIPE